MSVLTQILHERESWSNSHRELVERNRHRRAVVEFSLLVVVGLGALVYHARLLELVKALFDRI